LTIPQKHEAPLSATDRLPENHTTTHFSGSVLDERIMRLRAIDNMTNLAFLVGDYLALAAVMAGAIAFCEHRGVWGLHQAWNIPVVILAVVVIGGLQHRLAGLGHEASHYTLFKNKFLNDLAGDVFCMFPILAALHFYRLFHMAHHQYTNDPERDPDLVTLGTSKMADQFPMSRWRFTKAFYLRPFTAPLAFLKYQLDYIDINVLGRSENIYLRRMPDLNESGRAWPRSGATLGLAYAGFYLAAHSVITATSYPGWLLYLGVIGTLLVLAVGLLLPDRAYFPSPLRQPFSGRSAGLLRLLYYTWFLVSLGLLDEATAGNSTTYFLLLWVLPMGTSFMYFMLLRDVYQHTNADAGRLTNTRVFLADPFTRWAVFVHGQDMHLPHHLFPGVPHHRLRRLHLILKELHGDYAAQVVECHGTFANRLGLPTILDTLAEPRAAARGDDRNLQVVFPSRPFRKS
jgi:fatty acid desaturase